MKKKLLAVLGVSILTLYLAFLFVIPNLVNLNKYKADILAEVEKNVDLKLQVEDLKLYTTPLLKAGIRAKDVKVLYTNDTELANLDAIDVRLKLLPLIVFNVQIDSIYVDDPDFNVLLKNDGSTDLEAFVNTQIQKNNDKISVVEDEKKNNEEGNSFPLKFSTKLPKIKIDNYTLRVFDEKNKKTLAIKGKTFEAQGDISKNVELNTTGEIVADNEKLIGYNFILDSFVPKFEEEEKKDDEKDVEPIKVDLTPLSKIIDHKFKSDIDVDLKIRQKDEHILINGFANVSGVEFLVKNELVKGTNAKMLFKDSNADLDSVFVLPNSENLKLTAKIRNDKNRDANISINTDKLGLNNLFDTVVAFLDIANMNIGAEDFNVNGRLASDIHIQTNLKEFSANGSFDLENGSITHKQIPININGANLMAVVDNNNLKLAGATLVNDQRVNIAGTIDSQTNTDLTIKTDTLPLATLYKAFAPNDIKKLYDMQSGSLVFIADIKGKLSTLNPKFNLDLSNLKIYDKINKITVATDKVKANIDTDLKVYNGDLSLTNSSLAIPQVITLKSPKISLNFDTKDIIVNSSTLALNSSPITFAGLIKDYATNMMIDINAQGDIKTADIKTLLPKEILPYVVTSGTIPAKANISGNDKNIIVQAQALADGANYFTPLNINDLKGFQSLVNLKISTNFNNLKIEDLSLNKNRGRIGLKDDFAGNLSYGTQLAVVNGEISNISGKTPLIKNINISLPQQVSVEIPTLKESNAKVAGNLVVTGAVDNPKVSGSLSVPSLKIPSLLVSAENGTLTFKNNSLNVDCKKIDINDSLFAGSMNIKSIFDPIIKITDINATSSIMDVDKLFVFMDKVNLYLAKVMPPSSTSASANSLAVPVTIEKGRATVEKFSVKPIVASNITTDFSLFKDIFYLKNLKATAYEGNITGDVEYNLKTLLAKCKFDGSSVNVMPFVTDFTGIKDQVKGTAKFSANVSLSGADYTTQMKTLKGTVDFDVVDGQYGNLGKFETFLNAPNLTSVKGVATSIVTTMKTISPQNTGQFDNLTGHIDLSGGYANLNPVKSTGKTMSLYILGKFNLLTNELQADVYGNLAQEVVSLLGPINNLTVTKIVGEFGSLGKKAATMLSAYNQVTGKKDLEKIPKLSSDKAVKPFKVVFNGSIEKPAGAIKSFKWLATDAEMETTKAELNKLLNLTTESVENVTGTIKETGKNIMNTVLPSQASVDEAKQKVDQTKNNIQQQTNAAKEAIESFKQKSTGEKVQSVFGALNSYATKKQQEQQATQEQPQSQEGTSEDAGN